MSTEYFIVANSFAAPFVSDQSTHFQRADSPEGALEAFAAEYRHPCGLYAAVVYTSANEYHKGASPLARWLSNAAHAVEADEDRRAVENSRAGAIR